MVSHSLFESQTCFAFSAGGDLVLSLVHTHANCTSLSDRRCTLIDVKEGVRDGHGQVGCIYTEGMWRLCNRTFSCFCQTRFLSYLDLTLDMRTSSSL